jgi:hypothetical protein
VAPLPGGTGPAEPPTVENRLAPEAEPKPAPRADAVEWVPHLVQRGESFWTISQLYYGSARFYKALHAANLPKVGPLNEPLHIGQTIQIPPPEALDESLFEPVRSRAATAGRDDGTPSDRSATARIRPSVRPASCTDSHVWMTQAKGRSSPASAAACARHSASFNTLKRYVMPYSPQPQP